MQGDCQQTLHLHMPPATTFCPAGTTSRGKESATQFATHRLAPTVLCLSVLLAVGSAQQKQGEKHRAAAAAAKSAPPLLWRAPQDVAALNLTWGAGGAAHAPRGTVFAFVREDMNGSNPKYIVTDADGTKFTAKLGTEARPETVASRLTWATGYFTRDDYYLPEITVTGLPAHLHRGRNLIQPGGRIYNVRLERLPPGDQHVGDWHWDRNPFLGNQPFNGLRTLMDVIDNWDLKDENTAIYLGTDPATGAQTDFYLVSDLGSTFGMTHQYWIAADSEGNARTFARARFITHETADTVDFATPGLPTPLFILLMEPTEIPERFHMRWIRDRVPRADAAWMGRQLAQLSPQQLRDAFTAAGYGPADVDLFVATLQRRVQTLVALGTTTAAAVSPPPGR